MSGAVSAGCGLGGTMRRCDGAPVQVWELVSGPRCRVCTHTRFPGESIQSLVGFPKGLCLNEGLRIRI